MKEVYWWEYQTRRIGKGNPYHMCCGCGRSDPMISGRISAHGDGCSEVARFLAEKDPAETTDFEIHDVVTIDQRVYEYDVIVSEQCVFAFVGNEQKELLNVVSDDIDAGRAALISVLGRQVLSQILADHGISKSHIMWRMEE